MVLKELFREQGREQGRVERDREWSEWNQRRLEAESRDESFDEPPPGCTRNDGNEDGSGHS